VLSSSSNENALYAPMLSAITPAVRTIQSTVMAPVSSRRNDFMQFCSLLFYCRLIITHSI